MEPVNGKADKQNVVDGEDDRLSGRQRHDSALFIGGVILLGAAIAAAVPLAAAGPVAATAGYAIAVLSWVTLARLARLRSVAPSRTTLIAVALLLRLPFVFLEPELSDDVYRYRWDGMVSASGLNPFLHAPESPALKHLPAELLSSVNHPEIPTVYPPLAQALFWLWGLTGAGLWFWRLLITVADLFIVRFARTPVALFWATCPFVIFEGVWSGHIDGVAAAIVLGSWSMMRRSRERSSVLLASVAAGLKITPLAALPALIVESRARRATIVVVMLVLFVPFLPFFGGPVMSGFGDYATRWEFNGLFYELFKWGIELSRFDEALKTLFTVAKDSMGLEPVASLVYGRLYPAWLARVLCLGPLAGLMAFALRRPSLEARMAWSIAALLFASPTVHPWYWLVLLPMALLARDRFLVTVALSSPLSYVWYADAPAGEAVALVLCYALPTGIAILCRQSDVEPAANLRPGGSSK